MAFIDRGYHLTAKGQSLRQVLVPLTQWGMKNLPRTQLLPGSEKALRISPQ